MKPRDYFYKLKQEVRSLWNYPPCDLAQNPQINYELYWQTRRNKSEGLSAWQKQRAQWILQHIKPQSTILDLGCGSSELLKYLHKEAGIKGIGVDCVSNAFESDKHLTFIEGDLNDVETLKNIPEVDYVVALEVLEHLPQPEIIIQTLKPQVRQAFIASFPNSGYYTHRLRTLLGRAPLQWITHPGEHLRFWTVKDTKWWLKSLGFSNYRVEVYEGWPLLNQLFPHFFGQGLIMYAPTHKE